MEIGLETARRHVAVGKRVVRQMVRTVEQMEQIARKMPHHSHRFVVALELLKTTRALLTEMHADMMRYERAAIRGQLPGSPSQFTARGNLKEIGMRSARNTRSDPTHS